MLLQETQAFDSAVEEIRGFLGRIRQPEHTHPTVTEGLADVLAKYDELTAREKISKRSNKLEKGKRIEKPFPLPTTASKTPTGKVTAWGSRHELQGVRDIKSIGGVRMREPSDLYHQKHPR